jgi:VanZ family protein
VESRPQQNEFALRTRALFHAAVTRREFGKYWLPVLLWMALIFTISTDIGSMRHTSRFIAPFLRFFWPSISTETIHDIQVVVRKIGHVSGYAILAILIWRARNRAVFASDWNWRAAFFSEIVSLLYAISDEFHQSFVPSREASAVDVLIDCAGAAAGLAAIWLVGRARKRW